MKAFGAKGDGRTDDSRALQQALDALPARGGKLKFDKGQYLISKGLVLEGKKQFEIEGTGASLLARAGLPKLGENSLFTIRNCENFRIEGLVLDGNRANRPVMANQVPCHNLRLLDIRYANFINLTSSNAMQDGFTLRG
ncbi:MAG: glycosyl hydrolase family 28-related protein [Bacteroidia bacterium]